MIQCFLVAFLFSVSCVDSFHLHGWCVWQESLKTEEHVKALLRVILVACQASPASFAQGLVHIYFLLAISSCVWVSKLIFGNLWSANGEGHESPAQNKMAMQWYEQGDSAVIKSHLIYLKPRFAAIIADWISCMTWWPLFLYLPPQKWCQGCSLVLS
jgi:hypothetical protein